MKILCGIREACEEYADVSSHTNIRILIDTRDFSVFCDVPSEYNDLCIDLSMFANHILKNYNGKGSGARALENAIIDLVFKSVANAIISMK